MELTDDTHDPKRVVDLCFQSFPFLWGHAQSCCHPVYNRQQSLQTSRLIYIRLHHTHPEHLHLVDPDLVLFLEAFHLRWPLVLAPERSTAIGLLDRSVEVNRFMVVRLSVRHVLL
jgi:hypothetical protein